MRIETDLLQYEPMAMRLATYYHSRYDGRYDFQDLFLAAREGISEAHDTYDPSHQKRAKFFTHAHNCARNKISRLLRSDTGVIKVPSRIPKGVSPPSVVDMPHRYELGVSKNDGFEDFDRKMVILNVVQELSQTQQSIVRMFHIEQKSAREIGRELHIATNTVYSHLREAHTKMTKIFESNGITSWEDL